MRGIWDTEEYKELERKWYARLARNGFKDVEKQVGNKRVLKNPGTNLGPYSRLKREYYSQVSSRIDQAQYDHKADKFIMACVAEGWTIVDICKELEKKRWKCNRKTVRLVIRKYEALWGIRKWTNTK
jgi:hypothetical protein